MLHRQFVIATATVDGEPVRLRHGSLVVAARAEAQQIDWEAVLHAADGTLIFEGRYPVELDCITGVELDGRLITTRFVGHMFYVRQVDDAIVLRGDGVLEGFDMTMLAG